MTGIYFHISSCPSYILSCLCRREMCNQGWKKNKFKRSLTQIIIHMATATRVWNCVADSGWISVNFKLARQAPTQNSTVNPLLSQPIIHVWHIRGKVHSRILRSQHYYYHFFVFFYFLCFPHKWNQAVLLWIAVNTWELIVVTSGIPLYEYPARKTTKVDRQHFGLWSSKSD